MVARKNFEQHDKKENCGWKNGKFVENFGCLKMKKEKNTTSSFRQAKCWNFCFVFETCWRVLTFGSQVDANIFPKYICKKLWWKKNGQKEKMCLRGRGERNENFWEMKRDEEEEKQRRPKRRDSCHSVLQRRPTTEQLSLTSGAVFRYLLPRATLPPPSDLNSTFSYFLFQFFTFFSYISKLPSPKKRDFCRWRARGSLASEEPLFS